MREASGRAAHGLGCAVVVPDCIDAGRRAIVLSKEYEMNEFEKQLGKQFVCLRPWPHDGNGSPVADKPCDDGDDYHARKFDAGKADYSLLPFMSVIEVHWFWAMEAPKCLQLPPDAALLCATGLMAEYEGIGRREAAMGVFSAFNDVELPALLGEVVAVLEHGARKYARDSWRTVPDGKRRYLNAAWRHLEAMGRGEELDPDSGLPHRGHLLCNVLFVLELTRDT